MRNRLEFCRRRASVILSDRVIKNKSVTHSQLQEIFHILENSHFFHLSKRGLSPFNNLDIQTSLGTRIHNDA